MLFNLRLCSFMQSVAHRVDRAYWILIKYVFSIDVWVFELWTLVFGVKAGVWIALAASILKLMNIENAFFCFLLKYLYYSSPLKSWESRMICHFNIMLGPIHNVTDQWQLSLLFTRNMKRKVGQLL